MKSIRFLACFAFIWATRFYWEARRPTPKYDIAFRESLYGSMSFVAGFILL